MTIFHKIFTRQHSRSPSGGDKSARDLTVPIQITVLILLTWLCFSISVGGFFVADDIWQVNFAHKVFSGQVDLIMRNFTSNYLQLPSFDFYRPFLGFTYLFDYFFFKTNAIGYHLNSLVLYTSCVLLLFALVRTLTATWPELNRNSAAFFTAALFAVSPLHCEDVCWISGRADLLCAPFYLLSLIFVARSHQTSERKFYFLSLLCFWLAILSKEIGIGLPLVVAAYYFVWPREDRFTQPVEVAPWQPRPPAEKLTRQQLHARQALKRSRFKKKKSKDENDAEATLKDDADDESDAPIDFAQRFLISLRYSWPFFLSALVYLLVRYNALGTIIGGYSGMMGGALNRHILLRWFEPNTLVRMLLPFPESVLKGDQTLPWIMGLSLACCAGIAVVRLVARSNPLSWLVFLFIWMASTLLPLAKLWGVGHDLQTSRLLFFFTMAYSTFWPVLMFHPPRKGVTFKIPAGANRSLGFASTAVISIMIIVLSWTSFSTTTFWVGAGQEMEAMWRQTVEIARSLKDDKRALLLGIAKDYNGAHVNFNGSTYHHMLRPPWVDSDLSKRIVTFEPFIVGPFEVFNATRFKALLLEPDITGPYLWNREAGKFDKVEMRGRTDLPWMLPLTFGDKWKYQGSGQASITDEEIVVSNSSSDDKLIVSGLDLSPLKYDFLLFDLKVKTRKGDYRRLLPTSVSWNEAPKDRLNTDWIVLAVKRDMLKDYRSVQVRTSHYWRWFTQGAIKSLVIQLPDCEEVSIRRVRLVSGGLMIPFVDLSGHKKLNNGEYEV
ncbi:MAG: hypothetical protein K8F91_04640, partial [Candidatus Obscuribacterales bacterium]|nr:hypothetical protein [Candidatus Obscuribacterales bacterium]